jgi:hypothetical protein
VFITMIASQANSAAPAASSPDSSSSNKGAAAAAAVIPPPPPPPPVRKPAAPALPAAEEEEDEEVRLAMEMAIAAAQNPHLSPADLRKLVGEKNQQSKIVEQVQQKKEQMKVQEQEEATKRWNEKKERAWFWFKSKTESVQEGVAAAKVAAAKKAEELQFSAEKQIYAEQIRRDPETREIRKRMKVFRKALKAQRLNGNRVETRHLFKRQRMEKSLIEATEKLEKTRVLFCETNYQVTEYAKAMMRASKKWKRKGTDEELKLEAQLCRNMHQMLALEKQKSKVKKSTREIKKYLQRCKSWLSDKQALCEMHGLTLNATASSMQVMYEETLAKQDQLIKRLKETQEFKDVDLSEWDGSHFDAIPGDAGPAVILNALRGLPIRDSIRVAKTGESGTDATSSAVAAAVAAAAATTAAAVAAAAAQQKQKQQQQSSSRRTGKAPELFITARDDDSVNSELSDPDGGDDNDHGDTGLDGSVHSIEFEGDAPWMQEPEKDKKKSAVSSGDLKSPPPTSSTDEAAAAATSTEKSKKKEAKKAAEEKKPEDEPEAAAAAATTSNEVKKPASSGDTAETVPSNESDESPEEMGNNKEEEEEDEVSGEEGEPS